MALLPALFGQFDQAADQFDVTNALLAPVVGVQAAGQRVDLVKIDGFGFAIDEHVDAGDAAAAQGAVNAQAHGLGFFVQAVNRSEAATKVRLSDLKTCFMSGGKDGRGYW